MPIDAVNSAMTPLQFARARSLTRTVETNAALTSNSGGNRQLASFTPTASAAVPSQSHWLLPPATFHWSYRVTHINGKSVAKRTPQISGPAFWSRSLNRLG